MTKWQEKNDTKMNSVFSDRKVHGQVWPSAEKEI